MAFNPTAVRSANLDYSIYRSSSAPSELAEKGQLQLIYKNGGTPGSKWTIGRVFFGDDSGIIFTMNDAGQIQYTSSDIGSVGYAGTIKFEARSILQ